jgi:hypothetical protein
MRLFRRCCAVLVLSVGLARAAVPLPPPSEWKLPPVDGELSGELNAVILGGAPKVKWTLKLGTPRPRERTVEFTLEGYGLKVKGDAHVDPLGEGEWRITEQEINLGEWVGWLAPQLGPVMTGVTIGGTLTLKGEGTWRGGKLGGRAELTLRDGRLDLPKRKVLLEGIACTLVIEDLAAPRTAPSQVLTWQSGHYDVVALGAGRFEFGLDGDKATLSRATIAAFGGELSITGVTFSTKKPEFTASAQVTGFDVGQLVFLLPRVLASAKGKLDGYMDLARSSQGISIGAAYLGLRPGETAEIQFVPSPGILSASLPPQINKIYPGIAKVERDGIPMLAENLELRFVPEKDELGRTAWIRIAGRPVDPGFKGPIDLAVNIRGPLDQVLNEGTEVGLHLMGVR